MAGRRNDGWAAVWGSATACLVCGFLLGQEEPPADNPYLAPAEATPTELVQYLEDSQTLPKSIRENVACQEAVLDAAERLAKSKEAPHRKAALDARYSALFKLRDLQADGAQEKLTALAVATKDDPTPEISGAAKLVLLEDKVRETDLAQPHLLPALLTEMKEFFEKQQPLTERHLDLASLAVRTINAVDDDVLAYGSYAEFGKIFAKSSNMQLKKYGEKLVSKGEAWALLKTPLDIEGEFLDGGTWKSKNHLGKVYLIDFWASWCGPCVAEIPNLSETYRKYRGQGFEIVGVSLDSDEAELRKCILEKGVLWPVLFDRAAAEAEKPHPLAEKFKIKAIPSLLLVGKDGRIVKVNPRGPDLEKALEKLFAAGGKDDEKKPVIKPVDGPIPAKSGG